MIDQERIQRAYASFILSKENRYNTEPRKTFECGYMAGQSDFQEGQLIRLKKRMAEAVRMLEDLIDGGEECRGMDSAISSVIRKLEGN